jgi:hypothetical protein
VNRVKDFTGEPGWSDLHILGLSQEQIKNLAAAYYGTLDSDQELYQRFTETFFDKSKEKLRSAFNQPFYLRACLKIDKNDQKC